MAVRLVPESEDRGTRIRSADWRSLHDRTCRFLASAIPERYYIGLLDTAFSAHGDLLPEWKAVESCGPETWLRKNR